MFCHKVKCVMIYDHKNIPSFTCILTTIIFIVTSMNAIVNSMISTSPLYVITCCHPNICLHKLPHQDFTNDNTGA